ncbi:hypothetical protein BV22DRAFT_1134625 [Leucogyrophana mollusca]|uniref:Uncharacterized protein n=1 Tax=Leucogyrophana mollusca TaxID=85980 RepID=A0ACB8B0M1_9AGAM|nr:hypothetical protein BV22DRAFT_1134625 [Leucogyrophana mollusca]
MTSIMGKEFSQHTPSRLFSTDISANTHIRTPRAFWQIALGSSFCGLHESQSHKASASGHPNLSVPNRQPFHLRPSIQPSKFSTMTNLSFTPAALPAAEEQDGLNIQAIMALISTMSISRETADTLSAAISAAVPDSTVSPAPAPTASETPTSPATSSLPSPTTPVTPGPDISASPPALAPVADVVVATITPAAVPVTPGSLPAALAPAAVAPAVATTSPAFTLPVPAGHDPVVYQGYTYYVPRDGSPTPFYLVTKGRHLGVFSSWPKANPQVIGVSRAAFTKVMTIARGVEMMEESISTGQAELLT